VTPSIIDDRKERKAKTLGKKKKKKKYGKITLVVFALPKGNLQ